MQTQIPQNWQKVKIENIVNVYGGGTPSTQEKSYWKGEIPWLTPAELTDYDGRSIAGTASYITETGLKNSSARLMPEESILLTSRATIGNVAINTVPMATNQGFINIEPKEVDKDFFYYWLKGKRRYLNQIAIGSTFPELSKSVFKQIETIIPVNLNEQKHIASVLSAFDDKIEVNNKIAKTLEQMAQNIFKEWFVKFRFPGHEKVEFVDSELGKVPKDWEVKKIKDIAKVNKGLSYSSKEISEKSKGLPMINLANFQRGGGFNPSGTKFYTGKFKEANLVKPGDIIIAMTDLTSNREVIGHPARIPAYARWDKILISLDVCSVNTVKVYIEFLYYLMLRKEFSYLMASSAGGTNVAHLSPKFIENYEFALPDKDMLRKFQNFITSIFQKKNLIEIENQKLAAMRDLLLPKLMRGEIRV